MAIPTDAHIERIPLDGRDLGAAVKAQCENQASRDHPRKLVAATTINTENGEEVILFFELP